MSCAAPAAPIIGCSLDIETLLRTAAAAVGGCVSESRAGDHARDLDDVRRTLQGDGNGFRRLMERHQSRISTIMWRFSRDPDVHEELVGDVFIEAFGSLATFRAKAPFEHWLSRIATRVGYRHWKRERRERRIEMTSLENWHEGFDGSPEEAEPGWVAELIHRLVANLPPRDRLVITLRYLDDRSVEETAQMTGWSATMVKVQALRARRKLKNLFEQAVQEEDQ